MKACQIILGSAAPNGFDAARNQSHLIAYSDTDGACSEVKTHDPHFWGNSFK